MTVIGVSSLPDLLEQAMKKRAVINITQEAKSQMDDIKSEGQSYDGIIRELVKFWKDKKKEYWTRRREAKRY